jgi:hypothetical protein
MISRFSHLICVLLAVGLFLLPSFAMAEDSVLPSDVFTVIMLKSLSYDRNIDRQTKEKIRIGIVCFADDAAARDFVDQVEDNISRIQPDFRLKDKPIEGKVLLLEKAFDKAKFEARLKQDNISVLVVAAQNPDANKIIFETTRTMRINSICYNSECVREGAGLGIILRDHKPRMLINLSVVQQEGSDYSGKFLALCEVVK